MVEKKIYLETEMITKPETKDILCFDASEFETSYPKDKICEISRLHRLKKIFLNKLF